MFIAETARRRREKERRKTQFRYHDWIVDDDDVARFEKDLDKSSASKTDALQKAALRKAGSLNPIRVSDPVLPLPKLSATKPAETPISYYMEALFYAPEDGQPGPWATGNPNWEVPDSTESAQHSFDSNASLIKDCATRQPIHQMHLKVPWGLEADISKSLEGLKLAQSSDDWAEARVYTLAWLVNEALKRYHQNDDICTPLSPILDGLSRPVFLYARNVLWSKVSVSDLQIARYQWRLDAIKEQITGRTEAMMEYIFATEIVAEKISSEIGTFMHGGPMDPNQDRVLHWKLHLLKESLSPIPSLDPYLIQHQTAVQLILGDQFGPGPCQAEQLIAIESAAKKRLLSVTDRESITVQIASILSRQDTYYLDSPDPAADLVAYATQSIGAIPGSQGFVVGKCREYNQFARKQNDDLGSLREDVWLSLVSLLDPDLNVSSNDPEWLPNLGRAPRSRWMERFGRLQKLINMLFIIYGLSSKALRTCEVMKISLDIMNQLVNLDNSAKAVPTAPSIASFPIEERRSQIQDESWSVARQTPRSNPRQARRSFRSSRYRPLNLVICVSFLARSTEDIIAVQY
jgi:hypothetical protein